MNTSIGTNHWCCPRCHGRIREAGGNLRCEGCDITYPVVGDIPDFRIDAPSWVDPERDREHALELMAMGDSATAAELVTRVFERRASWTAREIRRRTEQVLELPSRMLRELDEWLGPPTSGNGRFLDLGCGSGSLLAAASRKDRHGIGVDVSLEWLVVARRMIVEHGGSPVLAAAMAESLPFSSGTLSGVLSLDVIEHVADQRATVREIRRVLAPGGVCVLATPNRFSLTAEPHVGIWGVGWLPRRWQEPYVRWRTRKPYDCRLLSAVEIRRLFGERGDLAVRVVVPPVPAEDFRRFSRSKAALARGYNRLLRVPLFARLVLSVSPFFRVIAVAPEERVQATGTSRSRAAHQVLI